GLILGHGARPVADVDVVQTVAFASGHIETAGDLIREGAGDRTGDTPGVEIAVAGFGVEAWRERWSLSDDVDDASRSVLAEQGALRPLQHFDARHLAQVAEADRV